MILRRKVSYLNYCVASLLFLFFNLTNSQEPTVKCDLRNNYLCNDGQTCIPKVYVCNGFADCLKGKDDETNCDIIKCDDPKKFFLCRNKKTCIGKDLICDDEPDCPDASDESDELCEMEHHVKSVKTCNALTEFHCGNDVCIPIEDICNGAKNCLDGSDEESKMCSDIYKEKKNVCPGFLCRNNKCLQRIEYLCDGTNDCGDGSDEESCTDSCETKDGKFLCASGSQCIDLGKVCDQNPDCLDKSDEGENCDKKVVNEKDLCEKRKCEEGNECKILPSGPACFCKKGYERKYEGNETCVDINECEIFGTCSQNCVNQIGSYYCTCAKGFLLNDDGKSCDTTSVNASLVYTTKDNIKLISLGQRDGYRKKIANTRQSVGVAFDGEFYYWTEVDMSREVIVKYNPETKEKEILLTNGLELPEYIAVDWLTKNIYFTDSTRQHVAVCTNDGYYCTELVKIDIMHYPRAIALHPNEGLLFWTDWGNNSHIGVSMMDGSKAKVLVDDVSWPNGLAIDWPNARIYWIDALSNAIESVKITGDDRRIILKGVFKHPFSLDVFGNTLYWSDHGTKSIEYCDKFTGKNHDVLIQGDDIFDVHIYDKSLMPYSKHGCENNPCSHICLLNGNGTYSCACPVGMELSSDDHNCRFNSKSFIIHIGIGSKLYSKTFQAFGRSVDNAVRHAEADIHKIEFNVLNGAIFYVNNDEHKLYILDSVGKSHLLLHDPNLYITSMSFDYLGNNLYWADNLRGTIEVFSITTKKRAIVHHYTGDYAPSSIVVVPTLGEIFVALVSQKASQINRVSMKGVSLDNINFQFVTDGLGKGANIYLAIDENGKKIYWSDAKKKRIEFANFDGKERKIFIQTERTPGPMTIVDNHLHWTSENSRALQWRNKNGTGPVKLIRLDIENKNKKYEFSRVFPLTTGNPIKINNHPCAVNNGGCSDICISDGTTSKTCLCATGRIFLDKSQLNCVDRSHCDFRCASGECVESKMMCDGKIDCLDRSDEDLLNCKKSQCKADQFSCDDGECISMKLKCDKYKNCKDGSDEKNCPKDGKVQVCGPRQVQCQNSDVCIYRSQICDMNPDCPEGTDELEESCIQKCLGDEFKCSSGQCILKEFECNHKIDCYDGSDEHENCSQMCEPPYKPCRDGHCIHERLFCDGVDDCEDKFDEFNCKSTANITACSGDQFQCPSAPEICLELYKKCDKVFDCPKGEDERGCLKCKSYQFSCTNGHCIDGNLKCDGKSDCSDHSDEMDCKNVIPPTTCTASNFKCSNGKCLEYKKVCDGKNDCDDDEGGQCSVLCKKAKCNQLCNRSPKGLVCSCYPGYELKSGSDSICDDINECDTITSSPCSQICLNTEGSYKCTCEDGFILNRDGHDCTATGDNFKLIYVLNNEIRSIDPSKHDLLYEASFPISDVAVDVRKNKLMYTVYGESGLYVLNMTSKTVELIEDFPSGIILAYDWLTENIYMTTRNVFNKLDIYTCSLRSKKCVGIYKLTQSRTHISSMDIDPIHNYLFFIKQTTDPRSRITTEIVSLRLDGSSQKSVFKSSDYNFIKALSVDPRTRTIYFTEQKTQSLQKINYQGEGRATFIHQSRVLMTPSALSNFESHAYILDESHGKIVSCKLYQDNECSSGFNVATSRRFIISHISKQIAGENKCENHKCPEICVNADVEKKCMCNNDKGQGIMCNELEHTELEMFTDKPEEGSKMAIWILLIMIFLFIVAGSAAFIYFRQRGFNYDMNINFHKNGTKIDDIQPNELHAPRPSLKERFAELSKTLTPFSSLDKKSDENLNNSFIQPVYPSNELQNFGIFSDNENGAINSDDEDDDQQRLIR